MYKFNVKHTEGIHYQFSQETYDVLEGTWRYDVMEYDRYEDETIEEFLHRGIERFFNQ